MSEVKTSIRINVEYFDGQEEGDVGYAYYVATSDDLNFVTDGATFEALMANVRECLALCLEDADSIAEYGVAPDANVQIIGITPLQSQHLATAATAIHLRPGVK